MSQPLTDAINALTTYANTITGESDTTLSDAVASLADGYGGGGGGLITIASGTFVGSNNSQAAGRQIVPIGKKMAQTDFILKIKAQQGAEFAYNSDYQWVWLVAVCFKEFGYYDLSSNGSKSIVASSSYYINSNNGGTISQKYAKDSVRLGEYIRNGGYNAAIFNTFNIWRNNTYADTLYNDFSIYLGHSNQIYPFPAVNYDYEVLYFGSDPTNDIVELS